MEFAESVSNRPVEEGAEGIPWVLGALGDLLVRLHAASSRGGEAISGAPRRSDGGSGLGEIDRRVMACLSWAQIQAGMTDTCSEVHHLMEWARVPLGEWLPKSVVPEDWRLCCLLDASGDCYTFECMDLAVEHRPELDSQQRAMFRQFREDLRESFGSEQADAYSFAREFIVRHPVTHPDSIVTACRRARWTPALERAISSFYRPLPEHWADRDGKVQLCAHCGQAGEWGGGDWRCRTPACSEARGWKAGAAMPSAGLLRTHPALVPFWHNPGIDELLVYDTLISRGIEARLYPDLDTVDVDVPALNLGIDLKYVRNARRLAQTLEKAGLHRYPTAYVVVPDAVVFADRKYLATLKVHLSARASRFKCVSTTELLRELTRAD